MTWTDVRWTVERRTDARKPKEKKNKAAVALPRCISWLAILRRCGYSSGKHVLI